jgi:hypothetical protein
VAERVEPLHALALAGEVRWEPNAPEACLVSDDQGRAALAQRAHPDDSDQRCVVLPGVRVEGGFAKICVLTIWTNQC